MAKTTTTLTFNVKSVFPDQNAKSIIDAFDPLVQDAINTMTRIRTRLQEHRHPLTSALENEVAVVRTQMMWIRKPLEMIAEADEIPAEEEDELLQRGVARMILADLNSALDATNFLYQMRLANVAVHLQWSLHQNIRNPIQRLRYLDNIARDDMCRIRLLIQRLSDHSLADPVSLREVRDVVERSRAFRRVVFPMIKELVRGGEVDHDDKIRTAVKVHLCDLRQAGKELQYALYYNAEDIWDGVSSEESTEILDDLVDWEVLED